MDVLREDDLRRARETPPGEKLLQALELMEQAIELKRAQLRHRNPDASDDAVDALLDAWLLSRP